VEAAADFKQAQCLYIDKTEQCKRSTGQSFWTLETTFGRHMPTRRPAAQATAFLC
jgi:hypothetical protein